VSDKIAYARHGDIAVLSIHNPPVNALSQAVRQGLMERMDQAEADDGVRAVLIVGQGRAFIAGADITEFGKPPMAPSLPDVVDRIEASPLLVIASMHGVSLGGGLEVALGCHYRIAVPTARIGLPEVHLGLIPGAGGTQRLPRVAGVEAALDIMTTGRQAGAKEAAAMGVIDLVQDGDALTNGLAYVEKLLNDGAPRRPVSEMPAPAAIDWDATYNTILARGRGQISPAQSVRAVQASVEKPFAEGMLVERQIFMDLLKSDQSKGMIHSFFSERAVGNLPELKGITTRNIDHIGVIGGGTMGAGIATAALLSGLRVTLLEMTAEAGEAAHGWIAGNLVGALKRGKITAEQHDTILSQTLAVITDYAGLADADLVIEAVFEEMAVKKQVFTQLDAVCKQGAILATNTSYLDVNEIAAITKRPQDVIGLHFFSPAHVMKLLEVVVGDETAIDVVATGFELGKRLKKISVRAGVCDGFIGNRILATYRAAADQMVMEGVSPYDIDVALEKFGFAMGPYAVADLAGLDIGWAVRKRKRAEAGIEGVSTYADKICEAGNFGQKTGKGYYDYAAGAKARVPNPDVMGLIAAERAEMGAVPRYFTEDQIVRRYMAAMVNEAAKVVGEGIARRPLDVDMTLLFGYGFPRYRGGPLMWADIVGLPELLADIEGYAQQDAAFWAPAPLLKELVASGKTFNELNKAG
jgi:3-hydroxyacyl-CoA dehydrogenase|tara:strand:+ start:2317 stop:4404 length:2088 start_codon:yes stop_codon:yes gene_type:complete